MSATRAAVVKLAKAHGCTLDEYPNGAVYLDAPKGKVFASCDSRAIVIASGASVGRSKPDWRKALDFAASEIQEGFRTA